MRRFRIAIAGAGIVIAAGAVAPVAAFADGGNHGGGLHSGTAGDHDSDDHPVAFGTTGVTGVVNVHDNDEGGNGNKGNEGHEHGPSGDLLQSMLSPSVPTDATIFTVAPGIVAWSIDRGTVKLESDGGLKVKVRGLVVTSTSSNPIPDVAVSVYCNGTLAGTTLPVTFSPSGNADIKSTLTIPTTCMVPAVLLHPATGPLASDVLQSTYIAFNGSAG